MKKYKLLLFLICVCFLLGAVPVSGNASQRGITEAEIYEMAEEVFPEYANMIASDRASVMPCSLAEYSDDFTIVESITRSVSEYENLTYQEYANGTYSIAYTSDVILRSSSSGSGYMLRVVDIHVVSPASPGALYISGFTYTLLSGAYDMIEDPGTTDYSTVNAWQDLYFKQYESSDSPALAIYYGEFPLLAKPTVSVTLQVRVEVGNEECTVSVTPYLSSS